MVSSNVLQIKVFDELKFSNDFFRGVFVNQEDVHKFIPTPVVALKSATLDWTPSLARSPSWIGFGMKVFNDRLAIDWAALIS